jgi:catechol 2,3-dioxygenase-like lactoylglutathione lyase family enzyme
MRRVHDAHMRIGHVHLKVADLDRAIAFYRDVLGLELTAAKPGSTPRVSPSMTWSNQGPSTPTSSPTRSRSCTPA